MAPAWRAEDVHQFRLESGSLLHIAPDLLELEEVVGHRVVRAWIMADPELRYDAFDRLLPGVVEAVPKGEDAAVVAVQVFGVAAVVYHVYVGRVEDILQPPVRWYQLRMQGELIERIDDQTGRDHDRLEAQQRHP